MSDYKTNSTMTIERKTTMSDYRDHELFGPRLDAVKLFERLKTGNDSECAIFTVGSVGSKEQFTIKDLVGIDKRLKIMFEGLEISYGLPVQRYSWPKIHKSKFANIFISAEATGKTYAILLYSVAQCLKAAPITEAEDLLNGENVRHVTGENYANPDELINHPKYIIICPSQDRVEYVHRAISHFKDKVYGDLVPSNKRYSLTPVSRTIKSEHDDDKLAHRCFESDILITSPQVLTRCLVKGFVSFPRCKKVFFDDLDVALQVHNPHIRDIIKFYIKQDDAATNTKLPQIHMFSSKWTDLVKQFLSNVFSQRNLLFNSISEAAVYSRVRFEVATYDKRKKDRVSVLTNILDELFTSGSQKRREKIAIVCDTDDEAISIGQALIERGSIAKVITGPDDSLPTPGSKISPRDSLFVLSDAALELVVEYSAGRDPLNDVMHLVHASLPGDIILFDQRFRLLYENIQNEVGGMTTTYILESSSNFPLIRHVYDLACRSPVTLKATKCELRDIAMKQVTQICWRWATTGLCRYEKLSRDDKFGSYCLDLHTIRRDLNDPKILDNNWPRTGLVKICITHIISPSEFYFMFEAFKTHDDGKWTAYETTGSNFMSKLQGRLNNLKTVGTRSIPLKKIVKGMIYAVFFPQESRVDRVRILDEPKHETASSMINRDLEYSKSISVYKIDHGVCLSVYVKNLVELPHDLAKIPAQCHRGFHVGYTPPDNEPDWLYNSKRQFYEFICADKVKEVTAWIRQNTSGCFWFEGMLITRQLRNIDSHELWTIDPYEELKRLQLADRTKSDPAFLPISTRAETFCRWSHTRLLEASHHAFLRRDLDCEDIFVLNVDEKLSLHVRPWSYNKQLIELEDQLCDDYRKGVLLRQEYIVIGVICLANIDGGQSGSSELCLNRVKILDTASRTDIEEKNIESTDCCPELTVLVYCLDHGDQFWVSKTQLFAATLPHIKTLPFQAIKCQIAHLNQELLSRNFKSQLNCLVDAIYDLTRDENGQLKRVKCKLNTAGGIYLYIPTDRSMTHFEPLYKLLGRTDQPKLHDKMDENCSEAIISKHDLESSDKQSLPVICVVMDMLRGIVEECLVEAKANGQQ